MDIVVLRYYIKEVIGIMYVSMGDVDSYFVI